MKKTIKLGLLAAGLLSLFAFGAPNSADARSRHRNSSTDTRSELRRDVEELRRDRVDLNQLYRSRASRSEIARKRDEIRQDLGEIRQDRQALGNNGWGGDRWDNRYGNGRYDNSSWSDRGSNRDYNRWEPWR